MVVYETGKKLSHLFIYCMQVARKNKLNVHKIQPKVCFPHICLSSAEQLSLASVWRFPIHKMYGLYLEAVNDYINESYGEDVWRLIENRAEIPHLKFVRHQMYK